MKREEREKRLMRLKELIYTPITRKYAYKTCNEDFETSVAAMRKTASRRGQTSKTRFQHPALSIEYEEGLMTLCSKHTQRGTPLSIPELI